MCQYGCDNRQKQYNRNYMAMDDIYVTIRMRHRRCDDRQSLWDEMEVTPQKLILSHVQNISEK